MSFFSYKDSDGEEQLRVGRTTALVSAAFLIVFVLFSSIKVIGVGQVGVLTTFGKVTSQWGSGVHFKAPWPFQSLNTFDIKIQKDEADADASSQDLQDVKATVVTNYHIDPTKVGGLFSTVGTDYKLRIIDPAIQESVKATTAEFPIADLVIKRTVLKDDIVKSLRARLDKQGIYIDDISITNLSFSDQYTKAIEAKQVAQQQAEQADFSLQKARLDAQANQVQQAALTNEILEQQAIAKWNGQLPTFLGQGSVFNIPLSK